MRIAFDVAQTCAERAGCAWYQAALAEALPALASGDTVILYHHFADWINGSTARGVKPLPGVEAPLLGMSDTKARALWRAVREDGAPLPGKPDLVQSNGFMSPDLRASGAKQVFVVYDVSFWTNPEYTTDPNRMLCQRGVFDAMRHADAFLFISDYSRIEFERLFPGWLERNRRPWKVVLLGTRFAPAALSDPRRDDFWYAAGTLEPRKNYDTLLDALEIYWSGSAAPRRLLISGGMGWKSEALRARIAGMESRGMVKHLGYVSEESMLDLYRNCFGFVFPSWYEGFGLPVLEAMSQGAPVISSDSSSLPEVGGDAVRYVSPGDAGAIADEMLRMERDEPGREALRAKAIARASGLTWTECARETLAFHHQLLGL